MKHFALLSLLLLSASAHAQYSQGLTLAWSEEFDRPGRPDPVYWGYEEGYVRNDEAQYYTRRPENVRIEDGCLVIEARREDVRREGGRMVFSPVCSGGNSPVSYANANNNGTSANNYSVSANTNNTYSIDNPSESSASSDNALSSANGPARSNGTHKSPGSISGTNPGGTTATASPVNNGKTSADTTIYKYTSGSINTLGHMEFFRGRIEVRAKLPEGRGTWPAIWTLGTDIGSVGHPECGEIDIMEYVGMEPFNVYFNVHTPGSRSSDDPDLAGKRLVMRDATVGFHIFALEWSESELAFFVDGRKVHSYRKDTSKPGFWRFDKPHYLLLNLAIGGLWGGQQGIDESIFPVKYYIDWVRYYK